MSGADVEVVTVTPNPAIDWTVPVPGFTPGTVNRAQHPHARPGGKGVNVAARLADYGCRVAVTGFLGRGNPAVFEELFHRKRMGDAFVRIDGETRVGIKITDAARQQTTDVNLPGPPTTGADVQALRDTVAGLAAPGRVFVLAGSLPPGVDPAFYAELTALLRAAGCIVALDTSGEPLRLGIGAAPHVAKPNVHELEALAGRPLGSFDEVVMAAYGLVEAGVELAAVSMGAEGALFVRRGRVVLALPPAVRVRSTVGAGDAMVAGIVAGGLAGLDLGDVARLATAFSLDALTRDDPATVSRAAIDALRDMVSVVERPDLAR